MRTYHLIIPAIVVAGAAQASPVAWDFVATGCSDVQDEGNGCVPAQAYPATVTELTLPGLDSSGSAEWSDQWGAGPQTPVFTGNGFSLDWDSDYAPLTPAFADYGQFACGGIHQLCGFDVSWSEVAGRLDALSVQVSGVSDTVRLGLGGGTVASDNVYHGSGGFAGCGYGACQVTGSWVDAPVRDVPEPRMLGVMVLLVGLLIYRSRHAATAR